MGTARGWMPHSHCFYSDPSVLIPMVLANGLIALAYFCLPACLIRLHKKSPGILPLWFSISFAAFILSCGVGHVVKIWTFWTPAYYVEAVADSLTAAVSVPTLLGVIVLLRGVGNAVKE